MNDRKESDRHPDRTGTAMIDGVMYYVSGWIKEGQKGKFMSLAFKRKDEQTQAAPQQSISQRATPKGPAKQSIIPVDDMNDEIPF